MNAALSPWRTRPTWHSPTQPLSPPSAQLLWMVVLPPSGGSTSVAFSALMSVSIGKGKDHGKILIVRLKNGNTGETGGMECARVQCMDRNNW